MQPRPLGRPFSDGILFDGRIWFLLHHHFGVRQGILGLTGHSMGGHGALTLALKYPDQFGSVSAFRPHCRPQPGALGHQNFCRLFGDHADWRAHCTTSLIEDGKRFKNEILIDQGSADPFLDEQLKPWLLETAMKATNQPISLKMREGYDHSYYHIASFIAEHLDWHAGKLG